MNRPPTQHQGIVPYEPASYTVGRILQGGDFELSDHDLDHHCAVLGGTGSGKSKFLEGLMRCFMKAGRGFCLIDPHGDLSEDLLAYVAHQKKLKKSDAIFNRLHYLEPSYEMVFGYDPFRFQPLHNIADDRKAEAYASWLHTKVRAVAEILQRKQGQVGFEGMPRLERVLTNVLTATGCAVDDTGRHLPLADALVLLDIHHQRHVDVFNRVAPFLDRAIIADFEILHDFKRPQDYRLETESTMNRLRSFLSPVVKGIFAETVHTIDFYSIMQRGEILLVNLRETDYFSADQANAIGGLFIHEILTTAARTPRDRRREFSLIIDEVGEFIGKDLMRALGAVRKYKLSLVLAGQDLTTFQKGDDDLSPKVLSQCGTVVCFQQTYKKDLEILVDRLGRGNLDFEELYQVMDRPDGYELLDMEDYSATFTWQDGWNEGDTFSTTENKTRTISEQRSKQLTWSHGRTEQDSLQHTDNESSSKNEAESRRFSGQMPPYPKPIQPWTEVKGEAKTKGSSDSAAHTTGTNDAVGGGLTVGDGLSTAEGIAQAISKSAGRSGSQGGSVGLSRRKQVIQKTREEWHPMGRLRTSVADQFEKMMTQIYQLGTAQCVVKLKSAKQAFFLQVADVKEMWAPENKFKQIEWLQKELAKVRAYLVRPQIGNESQDKRIDEFLQVAAKLPPVDEKKEADEPVKSPTDRGARINTEVPADEKNPFPGPG